MGCSIWWKVGEWLGILGCSIGWKVGGWLGIVFNKVNLLDPGSHEPVGLISVCGLGIKDNFVAKFCLVSASRFCLRLIC